MMTICHCYCKTIANLGSFRILLPFFRTPWGVGVLNSAIFNSFYKSGCVWHNFGGPSEFRGGLCTPTPSRYVTAEGGSLPLLSQSDHFDWYDRNVFANAWQESVLAELRAFIFVGALNKTAQRQWIVVVVPADFRTGYTWIQASSMGKECSVWGYLTVFWRDAQRANEGNSPKH